MIKFALLIIASFIATTGILFLRKVKFPAFSNISADAVMSFFMQSNLWLGVFFSGTVFLLYLWILSKYETSSVVPAMLGLNLAMVSLFAIFFFGESLTIIKLLAYSLIFSGVLLLI